MDALKLNEQTGLPFASEAEGVMHACGHDAHTAILLGVTEVLRTFRNIIPGNVKFLFQPSEEAFPGGALPMIQEGVLENPDVGAAFALHLDNTLPTGKVAIRHGPCVAGVTSVNINIRGEGGQYRFFEFRSRHYRKSLRGKSRPDILFLILPCHIRQ